MMTIFRFSIVKCDIVKYMPKLIFQFQFNFKFQFQYYIYRSKPVNLTLVRARSFVPSFYLNVNTEAQSQYLSEDLYVIVNDELPVSSQA